MEILGDRKFVEIPGDDALDLPPLLIHDGKDPRRMHRVMGLASQVVEKEDLVPHLNLPAGFENLPEDPATSLAFERRKMEMAVNLVETYMGLIRHWHWGDAILEWIRQCEITFDSRPDLKRLLRPDVWPHAGRSSFVTLLADKAVDTGGVEIERAVGMRLTFRQPPPLACCTDQFLFYLNSALANTAYQTWARMNPQPISALPPERFHVQVVTM
ncbi:MAG: hypothetical protein JJE04_17235 [Acidobacteriia bacterium]|nr:hypothetical protein [Terriglobia bacterium]